jgi:hypothetical protein
MNNSMGAADYVIDCCFRTDNSLLNSGFRPYLQYIIDLMKGESILKLIAFEKQKNTFEPNIEVHINFVILMLFTYH